MNMSPQVWAAIITVAGGVLGFYLNQQAAKRTAARQMAAKMAESAAANEVSLSAESREWLRAAQGEAGAAKLEAAAARKEASEARADAEAAGRAMRDATDRFESVMRWIERIVRAAHDESVSDAEVRRIVNGGPPELTVSRLPRV